ncbi:MAG: hypothetical protein Q4D88_04730 [Anaerococcus sp.]|nr:hypothetical protein [Anaerococcus sp.]
MYEKIYLSKKNTFKTISLAIIFLAIIIKQFYYGRSGTLQLGDFLYILPFFMIILAEKKIVINSIDLNIYIFVFFAIIINIIYYINYLDIKFIYSCLYLVYNLAIIYIVRFYNLDLYFSKTVLLAAKMVLIAQLIIYFLGEGRYFSYRYMGTFNDPNQFGYYIFSMLSLIHVNNKFLKNKGIIIWILIASFLIYLSQSTSIVLGLILFILLYFLYLDNNDKKNKYYIIAGIAFFLIFVVFILNRSLLYESLIFQNNRIINKFRNTSGVFDMLYKFAIDRSMTGIILKPSAFLYGSGEGMFLRFNELSEIHSTFIGFAFYYGLVPFLFFIKWIYKNISNISKDLYCVYISMFFIAFTLANHRQPTFWMLIVLAYNPLMKQLKRNSEHITKEIV